MDNNESPNALYEGMASASGAGGWCNRQLPPWISFGIALAAVSGYVIINVIAGLIDRADFVPPPLCFALYFAHFAGLGGLVGGAISLRFKKAHHAALWGAITGVALAGLLMT